MEFTKPFMEIRSCWQSSRQLEMTNMCRFLSWCWCSWYLDNTVLIAATIPRTAERRSRNMVSVAGLHLLTSIFKHLNWFDSLHGCIYSLSRGLCLTFHCRCSDSVNHESLHCGVTIKRILSEDSIFYLCLYLKFRIWVINHPTL